MLTPTCWVSTNSLTLPIDYSYKNSREVLRMGMSSLGFTEYLTSDHEGYIITSFNFPKDPNFDFVEFYERLGKKGMSSNILCFVL